MRTLTTLDSYAALLAAADRDPLVEFELAPELLAPPLVLGDAVLFVRENQLGSAGAVAIGPHDDVEELLRSDWRHQPGWAACRSITADRPLRPVLESLGVRGLGTWDSLSIRPGEIVRRPIPRNVTIEHDHDPAVARDFVARHHTARWIPPDPVGEEWTVLRDNGTGEIVATGLAAYTPGRAIRLTSIAVDARQRGRGLGWAVTQALVDRGLERSRTVILGVDEDNLVGRALYRAIGFRLDHELVSGLFPGGPSRGTVDPPSDEGVHA